MILAETLTPDTGLSLSLLLGLIGLLGGGIAAAIGSRVMHGLLLKQQGQELAAHKIMIDALKEKVASLELAGAVRDARHDIARQIADAIGDAIATGAPSASGVYSPKRGGG